MKIQETSPGGSSDYNKTISQIRGTNVWLDRHVFASIHRKATIVC